MKRRDCLHHFLGAFIAPASAATVTCAASSPNPVRTPPCAIPPPEHLLAADGSLPGAPASKIQTGIPGHPLAADGTLPHWLEDWRDRPLHPLWSTAHVPARWQDTAATILCHIQSRTRLAIEYSANNGLITRRIILPVLLHTKGQSLPVPPAGIPPSPFAPSPTIYLLAWCDLRQDHRTFRLSNFLKLLPIAA